MKYGDDDQPDEVEAARKRSQRWMQLSLMRKRDVVALHYRMMRERGQTILVGGPVTRSEYITAVMCLERDDEFRAAHLAEAGPGHEDCGHLNWKPFCTPCGATDGPDDDPIATCTKPASHRPGSPDPDRAKSSTHAEWRDGKLMASWRQVLREDQ